MDIAAIINAAIATTINNAVTAAVAPLQQEIAALKEEIAGLKNGTAQAVPVDSLSVLNAMDNSEWFWERVAKFVAGEVDRSAERIREVVDSAVEEAINDHCGEYDHDDYDRHISDDDIHVEDGNAVDPDTVRDIVKELLDDATVKFSL